MKNELRIIKNTSGFTNGEIVEVLGQCGITMSESKVAARVRSNSGTPKLSPMEEAALRDGLVKSETKELREMMETLRDTQRYLNDLFGMTGSVPADTPEVLSDDDFLDGDDDIFEDDTDDDIFKDGDDDIFGDDDDDFFEEELDLKTKDDDEDDILDVLKEESGTSSYEPDTTFGEKSDWDDDDFDSDNAEI